LHLKTDVFALAFGVEKGDEVEAQGDVPIQKAVEAVLSPPFQAPPDGRR